MPGGKGDLTDAGTRVPLIARGPGVLVTNTVTDALMDFSDFLSTLAELARARLPEGVRLDGQSFVPALRGEPDAGRTWSYNEHRGRSWVRDQRWKLYGNGVLFDMQRDPTETRPIVPGVETGQASAARERLQKVFEQLRPESSKLR